MYAMTDTNSGWRATGEDIDEVFDAAFDYWQSFNGPDKAVNFILTHPDGRDEKIPLAAIAGD